jgi:Raf kinase inhibitor-like YbhB/YbcL family protein
MSLATATVWCWPMTSNMPLGNRLSASAIALGLLLISGVANSADAFVLTSTTFKDGEMMPPRISNKPPPNPNCVGNNVSPQLSWKNAPANTKSYAFTLVDPEGYGGMGVVHWVAYGIPVSVTSFKEGELSKLSTKYVGGKSTQGVGYYSGPCTPPGTPHHYVFRVIATDLDPKALPPGLTLEELQSSIAGHTKGAAALVGLFAKPRPD